MTSGYVAHELLAWQAGLLLAALVAVGLTAWLVAWRRPASPWRTRLTRVAAAGDPWLAERLAWPVRIPRQVDPGARRAHRPRAPSPVRSHTAAA